MFLIKFRKKKKIVRSFQTKRTDEILQIESVGNMIFKNGNLPIIKFEASK